jgi:predicted small lipoprotein YifL
MPIKFSRQFFFLVLFLVFISCTACGSKGSLQIIDQQLTTRQFTGQTNAAQSLAAVTGTAKNISNSIISGCEIKVTFLDERKDIIGVASTTRESLGAGEVWYFTAQLTNPDAWKARSYEITSTSH